MAAVYASESRVADVSRLATMVETDPDGTVRKVAAAVRVTDPRTFWELVDDVADELRRRGLYMAADHFGYEVGYAAEPD